MNVRVAVCTNRRGEQIAPCLRALVQQVPADRVVVVGSGVEGDAASALAAAVDALIPGAEMRPEASAGLSRARNRALEGLADDEVIAYVDDDAVVPDGWFAALCRAWAQVDDEVACLGGPVRVRFEPTRPRWMHPALEGAYSGVDYGARARDVAPAEEALRGANMSFRVGLLRAVGAFDERYGHAWTKDWYGDEDAAERALADAGWRIRYVPEPWLWHVIDSERLAPQAVLQRRFWYGAGVGHRGLRSWPLGLRWAVRGALATIAAAARADAPGVMVNAVFTCENAGAVVGRIMAGMERRRRRVFRSGA